jgi:hypothetical protein
VWIVVRRGGLWLEECEEGRRQRIVRMWDGRVAIAQSESGEIGTDTREEHGLGRGADQQAGGMRRIGI